jgi:hypothetical protein
MRRCGALWRWVGHRRPGVGDGHRRRTDRHNNLLPFEDVPQKRLQAPLHLDGDGGAAPLMISAQGMRPSDIAKALKIGRASSSGGRVVKLKFR